jgi:hypothetical protein
MKEDIDFGKPEESVEPTLDWHEYRAGKGDRAGRRITEIYAVDDDYVIYFAEHIYAEATWDFWRRWLGKKPVVRAGWAPFYETDQDPGKDLAKADAALAGINRLLDDNQVKGSREYNFNYAKLELAADALEMVLRKEEPEGLEILNDLRDELQTKEEGQRRLFYQGATAFVALLPWIFYLFLHGKGYLPGMWNPWMLAAAMAMAGGLFSVCLNIGSLEVNVNQGNWFLWFAGATRSAVACLAGIGMFLAMRSKLFGGITYGGEPPKLAEKLWAAELFFCFLAGFSESFVPNILSKTAEAKAADKEKAAASKAAAAAKAEAKAGAGKG